MNTYQVSPSCFGCRLKLSDNAYEIISVFSNWLGKPTQDMSHSKMKDSNQVTAQLPSCSNMVKMDGFSLGLSISHG